MSSLFGGSSSSSSPSSSSSTTQNIDLGLQMSGVPPPVAPKLYKRNRLRIKELLSSPPMGSTVTVCGWARTIRNADAGKLLFIELNDGSTTLSVQCVLKESTTGFEESKSTKSGGTGASFEIVGEVIQSEGAGQAIEILVIKSTLLGAVYGGDAEGKTVGGAKYPLSKKGHTLEHLREHAHLRPRSKVHSAAMRVRHAMAFATHKFFNDNGFLYVHTPIITCADCEGAGEQFGVTTMFGVDPHKTDVKVPYVEPEKEEKKEEAAGADGEPKKGLSNKAKKKAEKKAAALAKKAALQLAEGGKPPEEKLPIGAVDYTKDFFAKRANLTVSGQLNVETHCCAMSDVYTFGPTFRAENSHTSRHLAEFWMIEPEIAFADLHDDINLAEDYIKYCVTYALEVCKDDLEFFETSPFGEKGLIERLKNVIAAPFKVRIN
ncbi:hypothetical protein TL16_g02216 [Triparma laevis f. inornata]|uniref:Aminoacyl-transfer RNA synthetases class-II family profile domain-containing protein n=1 Tax=Triparma laevis f. inornata TaxID=1714386 RepID=A0A9W7DWJ5_9STRA|nr:hypothetical protein TL16_g02216 [Triparma laevis f. inornata]